FAATLVRGAWGSSPTVQPSRGARPMDDASIRATRPAGGPRGAPQPGPGAPGADISLPPPARGFSGRTLLLSVCLTAIATAAAGLAALHFAGVAPWNAAPPAQPQADAPAPQPAPAPPEPPAAKPAPPPPPPRLPRPTLRP